MLSNIIRTSALCLLVTSLNATAEIYKWTDAQGNVHYSQTPPDNAKTKTETIASPPPPAVPPKEATESLNNRLEADKVDKLQQAIADQNTANLKKKQENYRQNCKIAKKNYATYTTHSRVRVKEADGSYTQLTEEQRQQRISDMKAKVTEFCDTPVTLSESETAHLVVTEEAPADPDTTTENTRNQQGE